jgi:hypothetical protein
MLVAKREPLFHSGAYDGAAAGETDSRAGGPVAGFTRLMVVLQLAGSLLAIPLGLASGYTIYRANFSPQATCQTLRGNILATLDKSVDATTRRMLVGHDVATFENTCAAIDPDAVAAFKRLLTADAKAPAASAAHAVAETRSQDVARKAEPRPAAAAREIAKVASAAAAAPARRDDAWVAAVRQALLTQGSEPALDSEPVKADAVIAAPPVVRPMPLDLRASRQVQTAVAVAPALPPAAPATTARAPAMDHPVPPASIPEISTVAGEALSDGRAGSRLGGWIARIPFVGHIIDGRSR